MIKINGETAELDGMTVSEYLSLAGFDEARVAVELGGAILPKEQYGKTVFRDGDSVEIVRFVGGG